MARVLREQRGKRYDPNRYASERIAVPVRQTWLTVCAANTVEAYSQFMEVWPTYSWYAEKQIRELRYPPHLRRLMSGIGWALWGALVLIMLGLIIAHFR